MSISIFSINAGLLEIMFPILELIPIVRERNKRLKNLISLILSQDPDIIIIQELNGSFERKLTTSIKKRYPYKSTHTKKGEIIGNGLCTYSKFPIVSSVFTPYSSNTIFESIFMQKGILKTTHQIADKYLTLLNTHLVTIGFNQNPQSKGVQRIRDQQIENLTEVVKDSEGLVVIGGDFNTGPEVSKRNYKNLTKNFYDTFTISRNKQADSFTWDPKNHYVQRIFKHSPAERIDGFYLSKNTKLNKIKLRTVIFNKNPVSDHYGVLLNITQS